MQEILGGYTEVELRDGRKGNYEVARQYYRDFDRLRIEDPDGFNRICDSVLATRPYTWSEADKKTLATAGLAFASVAEGKFVLKRPEEEIREFVRISTKEASVGQIFGIVGSGETQYTLRSPFKHSSLFEPDEVADKHRKHVAMERSGSDTKDYPGHKLLPK